MSCFSSPCARRLRMLYRSAALLALSSLVQLSPLAAQSDSPAATVEDEITVTATRSPRFVKDTPGAVSVISEEEIDRELMTNVADLVRFEPGVYVDSDLNRLGLGGFNIRGIGGNRVLTRVDGIATAERFEFGPLAVPQYALDLSALKSVEIVRSAGSALYGSDALGGVVTLLTKDPADYLSILGGRSYVEARAGYAGRNRERFESGALALGGDRWQGSLFAARSDGHEMETQGTAPNPQDNNATNALGKLVYAVRESSSLKLTGEVYRAEAETQVISSQVGSVIDFDADDEKRRDRISLEQTFVTAGPLFDHFEGRLYVHENETEQRTFEEIVTATRIARRGLLTFEQSGLGGEAQLRKSFTLGGAENLVTYGLSWDRDDFDQIRDRRDKNLVTGADDVYRGPLVFPTKYFPESQVEEIGIFLQDEISFGEGRIKLVPGLRYDRYSLAAEEDDPVYLGGNPGILPPADLSVSSCSGPIMFRPSASMRAASGLRRSPSSTAALPIP
jgi:hemoglobin/transferrin/lactoferrin receptor protein